ncbi:hypothetical protein [Massilia rubra]|uniref:Uncharacterized protein n=1 Tax=Massilia rubra TaxID=2607910 RepID=A0ABX0LJG9_9BURK|nr:hypothetical protein [Massilia rubra]NHZ32823.1 hypothetical protein [Massilia rubra]
MSTYTFTVNFKSGIKIATYTTNCPTLSAGLYNPQPDDKLQFIFNDDASDIQGGKLSSSKMDVPERSSPFSGAVDGSMSIVNNSVVSFDVTQGSWCFYISFYAKNNAGKWEFHLLPDPELQVGSIPN